MERYAPSGIKILIVGGGIAGLGFAIEAYRKGHEVSILERRPDFNDYGKSLLEYSLLRGALLMASAGDLIAFQPSCLATPEKWPGFMERCREVQVGSTGTIHKYDGTQIGSHTFPLAMSRAVFINTLHEYTQSLGIKIKFSSQVIEYFETDDHAGVILEDGTAATADIVVAADGVGSKSWKLVSGFKEKATSSGFALFRATFPAELALDKPSVAKEYGDVKDRVKLIAGPGAHVILARAGPSIIFMLTHRVRVQDCSLLSSLLADIYALL